mmetsp:Transcript_11668/g.33575  ORF Transcript_11668/g.33575 Transcript_11668/m.33575 type:complete len:772 (-) Transcript_11668:2-2317(-)
MSSFSARYDKISVLGEGAYGVAYLVAPKSSSRVRQVAKEIRVAHLSEKQKESALAESKVLQMMKHSNIVAHVDTFMEGPRLYIVMEYADGGDLATKIKERKDSPNGEFVYFDETQIMFIFVQVALALQHIHSHNVLHRDLKPLNIFLTRQGIVKLGDFGIARVLDNSVGAQTTIGTPHYLSPEICNNEPYGTRSDLWSLGVVTYELSALKVPFSGTSLPAVALQIIGADPSALPEWYSPQLSKIVFGLLDKNPLKRPSLEQILGSAFVQQYIERNLSHTVNCGHGGLEVLGKQNRTRKAGDDRGQGERRLERQRSDRRSPPPTSPESCPAAAGGRPMARVASKERPRDAPPRSRLLDGRAAEERAHLEAQAAREREFHYNRQLAMETKMRVEQDYRAAGLANLGGGAAGARRQPPAAARYDDEDDDRGERRKAEVRRRAQARREEEELQRKQELDRAMREAAEERRRLQQRMLAMHEPEAPAFGGSGGEDADSPAHDATNLQQLADEEDMRARRSDRRAAEEQQLEALAQARREHYLEQRRLREKFAAAVAEQEGAEDDPDATVVESPKRRDEGVKSPRRRDEDDIRQQAPRSAVDEDAIWVEKGGDAGDGEDDGRRHVEIVIPFTNKVRPKPKLSSDGKPPRRRQVARSESVPADAGGVGRVAPASSRGSQSPSSRPGNGRLPPSRSRPSFDDDAGEAPRRPPRLPDGIRQQSAAGSPARWLPKQAPPEDLGDSATGEPTGETGFGDMCLLQDALANALRQGGAAVAADD